VQYLTKSRFKLALECPTKLYYGVKVNGYFDKNQDNDFLQALADGGNQIGELAKYKYHEDPVGSHITVEPLEYDLALKLTAEKLDQPGRVIIAEAALLYAPYFVRVDILIRDQDSKTIDLIEVKSKSVSNETIAAGFKNTRGFYDSNWLPYLYDVAFQAEVAKLVFPGFQIRPKLLLIDSAATCDVDGLHQRFMIVTETNPETGRSRTKIRSPQSLSRKEIGDLTILKEVDVSNIVADLRSLKINNEAHIPDRYSQDLPTFMKWAGELQISGQREFFGLSKNCRSCQFRAPLGDPKHSGIHECWKMAMGQGLIQGSHASVDRSIPLSIDLWGGSSGSKSLADAVIKLGRAFLSDIQEEDILPGKTYEGEFMSPLERRLAQIRGASGHQKYVLDEDRLAQMDEWEWPLHMIDFETSAPAIPFFKGMRPYQTLAFQFSHHIMEKDGQGNLRIRHANQWISTEPGVFPSIDFVRALREALMPTGELQGTVFRYHNHENTVLRGLRKIIKEQESTVPDSNDLIAFIDLVTKATGEEAEEIGEFVGQKAMVDLHRLIKEGYYSSKAGGSISLKFILPAILHDAHELAALYRRSGVYGVGLEIQSLNFDSPEGHVWLREDKGNDPYKTLPAIFGSDHGELNEMLLRLAGDDEEDGTINQGGLAMTAYNFTQFNSLKPEERKGIEDALLRYCELDTLAMVMLVQGLMELRMNPKN
jgi:hypothetical protein